MEKHMSEPALTPEQIRYRQLGVTIEVAHMRLEAARTELMALGIIGDQRGMADHRQKMHDLLDVIMDSVTEAATMAKAASV